MAAATANRRRKRSKPSAKTLGRFESTAYGPPWDAMNGTGVTAGGTDLTSAPKRYIVAVDPDVIPLGTKLRIWPNPFNYRGAFLADDTGGAIQGRRIDFYDWRGRSSQLAWGRRTVEVGTGGVGQLAGVTSPLGSALDDVTGAAGDVLGAAGDAASAIPDAISRVAEVIEGIARFFIGLGELLLTPEGWLRVGKLTFGVVALWFGLARLADAVSGGAISRAVGTLAGGVAITGRRVSGAVAKLPRPAPAAA